MRTGVIAKPVKSLLALVLAGLFASVSNAAIFEDGEARRAILELRQRVDSMQAAQQKAADEHRQDTEQLRRILLDLQNQIEVLRVEQAKLRGQNEQLIRDVADLQRRQKDIAQGVDERLSKFEPVKVTLDGQEFQADPAEKRDFEAALAVFRSGKFAEPDDNRFHILGLAPNAARISIRFYHCVTLQALGQRIAQHFDDLALVRGPNDVRYPSLFRLLTAVALQNKADNIPPNLGGAVVDAILAGPHVPYPSLWLNAAVGRCRAEQTVNYLRAAAIKACLNRQQRHAALSSPSLATEKEFLPMLDLSNTNPAYRLGRLFAVLEKIQEEASPGLNATIRDRYYGAASSTPVAVFTTLLRLKNAHLKKLSGGRVASFEKLLGDLRTNTTRWLMTVEIAYADPEPLESPENLVEVHLDPLTGENAAVAGAIPDGLSPQQRQALPISSLPEEWERTNRNAPCPCGSGKKFKQCHGA